MSHSFRIKIYIYIYSNVKINLYLILWEKKLFFMCFVFFFFADVETRIDNLLRGGDCVCLRLWSLILVGCHTSVVLLPWEHFFSCLIQCCT